MEKVRKHMDIRLVTRDKRRSYLVPVPNNHKEKRFSENLLTTVVNKTKIKMNKLIYFGLSVLEISKTLMYKFWYDYTKIKYLEKKSMLHDSFIVNCRWL